MKDHHLTLWEVRQEPRREEGLQLQQVPVKTESAKNELTQYLQAR